MKKKEENEGLKKRRKRTKRKATTRRRAWVLVRPACLEGLLLLEDIAKRPLRGTTGERMRRRVGERDDGITLSTPSF